MNKIIFAPIILLFAVCLAVFLVWPQVVLLSNVKKQVAKQQKDLQEKQAYYLNLKNTLQELENYQGSISAISAALPEEFSLAGMLDYFQREAIASGLVLKNVGQNNTASPAQPSSPADVVATAIPSRIKEAFFSISVQGSVESIEAFLKKLEMSSRIIEVESLNLKAQSEAGLSLSEMSFTAKVYHY